MTPLRLTRPNVGRSPATPQREAGPRIDPPVSVPTPNATSPAAVADAGPADEPLEPSLRSQGLLVRPPNHWSSLASSPVDDFATSTPPASRINRTTLASESIIRSLYCSVPHVVE